MNITATAGFEHTLGNINGTEPRFYRVDDKADSSKVKEDSKYYLVVVSAKQFVTLAIGKKDNKFSISSMEYEDDEKGNDKWATAIRNMFSKKLVKEITAEDFEEAYEKHIRLNVEGLLV